MGQKVVGIFVAILGAIFGYWLVNKLLNRSGDVMAIEVLPEPVLAQGSKKFVSTEGDFSIHLPTDYAAFDPSGPQVNEIIAAAKKVSPQMEPVLRQAAQQREFKLMAFNMKEAGTGFSTNLNVLVRPSPGHATMNQKAIDEFRAGAEKQVPAGGLLKTAEFARIPIGDALQTHLQYPMSAGSTSINVQSLGYTVIHKEKSYTLTFSCEEKQLATFRPIVERAIETFRLKN